MSLKKIFSAVLFIGLGFAAGYALSAYPAPGRGEASSSSPAAEGGEALRPSAGGEREILYWYDPMYPGTRFDKPGKSPFMDMDLVPRYAEADEGSGILVDPAQVRNLAVRTERAVRGALSFTREIPANLVFNDSRIARAQPRAEGFVEKTYALAVGDTVTEEQPLADITVPAWAADQSEYLLLRGQKAEPSLVRGVRERLRLSGMPEELLKAVESSGRVQTSLTVRAPIAGVITGIDVYPGMNVDKGMTLATIQGTDPIWLTAEVPERDMLLVGGTRLRVSVPAHAGRVFHASSYTLLPNANAETRTVPLRLSLDNADGLLRPGLTASVRLRGSLGEGLLVPAASLIDLGEEQRVIARTPDGRFVPKKVTVLRSEGERTLLADGLEEGEEIVVSGLFLIDSEANLRGALERMRRDSARAGEAAAGYAQ
ncbi:MAG: efflux RND transporter periplasmic adaptor subunit [Deltaproteobacteria bacterium]|jgi:Cu(I)/Ag(I) efflux system membrane fusion protein|nr:efflux RND transporter periplasmic adaptor subunit [Deltaproteobacteria bacterium]